MNSDLWSVIFLCFFVSNTYGVRFNLLPNTQKCLKDEVQAHQLTVIDFEISEAPAQQVNYIVRFKNVKTHKIISS